MIILWLSARQQKRDTEIRAAANMDTTKAKLRKRRLRCLGHVSGIGTEHIPRQLLICKWKGCKRTAGGQRLRLLDILAMKPRSWHLPYVRNEQGEQKKSESPSCTCIYGVFVYYAIDMDNTCLGLAAEYWVKLKMFVMLQQKVCWKGNASFKTDAISCFLYQYELTDLISYH